MFLRIAIANVTAWRSGLACFKEGAMPGFDVIGCRSTGSMGLKAYYRPGIAWIN